MTPRITALRAERHDKVRIELDGLPWRMLPMSAVLGAGLDVGVELDRDRARELGRQIRRLEANVEAQRFLARNDRSAAAVVARLKARGVAPAERRATLETLEGIGYVDDARFAIARAERLAAQGYGDEAIRYRLETDGIAHETAEAAVHALEPESRRAATLVARSGRTVQTARLLARKGFDADTVEELFAAALDDATEDAA